MGTAQSQRDVAVPAMRQQDLKRDGARNRADEAPRRQRPRLIRQPTNASIRRSVRRAAFFIYVAFGWFLDEVARPAPLCHP
jgi:hypothetical protein